MIKTFDNWDEYIAYCKKLEGKNIAYTAEVGLKERVRYYIVKVLE